MRIEIRHFFVLFFVAVVISLLNACNFGVPKPGFNSSPTLPTETQVIPTDTATFISMPTAIPTSTPLPTLPPSAIPSITPTSPTFTPTPQWSACPGIVITATSTNDGNMLHVRRCDDGWEHDFGPLAKGIYAVAPNDNFFVYVTISGYVYGARIGDTYLSTLFDLVKEREFTVINKKLVPDFEISFVGEAPDFRLVLVEKRYDQKRMYDFQPRLTH